MGLKLKIHPYTSFSGICTVSGQGRVWLSLPWSRLLSCCPCGHHCPCQRVSHPEAVTVPNSLQRSVFHIALAAALSLMPQWKYKRAVVIYWVFMALISALPQLCVGTALSYSCEIAGRFIPSLGIQKKTLLYFLLGCSHRLNLSGADTTVAPQ